MLWVYYSSLIVFFGAELIKSMAAVDDVNLRPKRYAAKVESVVVEEKKAQKRANEKMTQEEQEILGPSPVASAASESREFKIPE